MSKVIRLTDQANLYIENFKHYSRCLDDLHGCHDHMIDVMSDSNVLEYMLSYAVKVYRDRYELALELND